MKQPEIALLPCPFCGGEAGFGQCLADSEPWWFVNCVECMASTDQLMGHAHLHTQEEAAGLWNARSAPRAVALPGNAGEVVGSPYPPWPLGPILRILERRDRRQ